MGGVVKQVLKWGVISFAGFIALVMVIGIAFGGSDDATVVAPDIAAEATAEAQDAQGSAEAKAKDEAEEERKAKAEEDRKARAEAQAKAEADAEERAKEEAKAQAEEERKAEAEERRRAEAEKKAEADKRAAKAEAKKKADAEPKGQTVTVTNVVAGDTVDLSNGERVRVIGIDTPERGECGFTAATKYMESLVLGKQVNAVPGARDDRDRYDRILRYLDAGKTDAGLALIEKGYANARYDSRDGYGAHPREQRYVNADARTEDNFVCHNPAPEPAPSSSPAPAPAQPTPQPAPPAPRPGAGYTGCRAYIGGPYIDDQGRHYTPIDCQTRQPLVP